MTVVETTALVVPAAFRVKAAEAQRHLQHALRSALAARASVDELVGAARALDAEVSDLAQLVAEDLRVHDHAGCEAHLEVAASDLDELLALVGSQLTIEESCEIVTAGGIVDVTVGSESGAGLTLFIDTTPRRPVRVVLDERLLA